MRKLITSVLISLSAIPALAQPIETIIWKGTYKSGYIIIVNNWAGKYIGWEYRNDTNNEAGIIICERQQARTSVGDKIDRGLEQFLIQKGCK